MIGLARKTLFGLKRGKLTDVLISFKTDMGAYFYDKDLGNIKGKGFNGHVETGVSKITQLYLELKTFKEDFESIVIEDHNKKIVIYTTEKRPATIHIKGIDYEKKTSGLIYIDVYNYPFVLLLSYLREFLSVYPVLSVSLYGIDFSYNKDEKLLIIYEKDLEKVSYIEKENITAMKELLDNYNERGIMFTHSFTPDRSIFIDKELNFIINDKKFSFELYKKINYLLEV